MGCIQMGDLWIDVFLNLHQDSVKFPEREKNVGFFSFFSTTPSNIFSYYSKGL